ncbi:MAG: hypothetical protein EBR93_05635 [Bacteroidetes bacterium]|nr:hypothetical protein [Bacteroidota bacterium]
MSFSKEPIESYIFTTSININSSTANMLHKQSYTHRANETITDTELVTFTQIDLRIFVIPFSATASAATAAWLFLCREGIFNNDPTWDDSLFEADAMWTYEIIHYLETFFMTIALLTASSHPRSFEYHLFLSSTLTALYIFFATTSRFQHFSVVSQCINSAAFTILGSILVSFLIQGMELSCSLAVVAGWVLAIIYVAMTMVYQTAKGNLTAGAIITARTLVANFVTLIFCVILFMGRTEVCDS